MQALLQSKLACSIHNGHIRVRNVCFSVLAVVPAADSGKLKLAKMQTATDMNLSTQFKGGKKNYFNILLHFPQKIQ